MNLLVDFTQNGDDGRAKTYNLPYYDLFIAFAPLNGRFVAHVLMFIL